MTQINTTYIITFSSIPLVEDSYVLLTNEEGGFLMDLEWTEILVVLMRSDLNVLDA